MFNTTKKEKMKITEKTGDGRILSHFLVTAIRFIKLAKYGHKDSLL